MNVTFSHVAAAAERIRPFVHHTPVLTSRTLDHELSASVFWKCENLQRVGAFKARGAVNAVLQLGDIPGVLTHSSGNHAAAVAYAASLRKLPCVVVMPESSSTFKINAVRRYGAEVVFCREGEREKAALEVQARTNFGFVHPFEDPNVIAGQGTAALELVSEIPNLDIVISPLGGGGLASGTALVVRHLLQNAQILAAEPELADDGHRALAGGARVAGPSQNQTIADGLRAVIGAPNAAILTEAGVEVITVSEAAIVSAARAFLEVMKIVVEPSAATTLAALRKLGPRLHGKRIGAILTGGNTTFDWLSA